MMASPQLINYGYACQFVEKIPKELQTECSICLHTVREPQMVDCCGYRFCKRCIEPLKLSSKKCPLCNCNFTSVIPDKLLQRTLNQKRVYCVHKGASKAEVGCCWVGELGQFDKHLNAQPENNDKRMNGCSIQKIDCVYCKVAFQRCKMTEHETNCPEKIVTCQFCNVHQATLAGMVQHWSVCPDYPADCPNDGCKVKLKRKSIDKHIEEHCPYTVVPCKYAYAGCEVKLQRKVIQAHLDRDTKVHLALLDDLCTKQRVKNQELEGVQVQLKSTIDHLQTSLTTCTMSITDCSVDCHLLKELVSLRGEHLCSNSNYEILVTNLSDDTTEDMIKSLFGQHGTVDRIEFYEDNNMAVVEYEDMDSVDKLFAYTKRH